MDQREFSNFCSGVKTTEGIEITEGVQTTSPQKISLDLFSTHNAYSEIKDKPTRPVLNTNSTETEDVTSPITVQSLVRTHDLPSPIKAKRLLRTRNFPSPIKVRRLLRTYDRNVDISVHSVCGYEDQPNEMGNGERSTAFCHNRDTCTETVCANDGQIIEMDDEISTSSGESILNISSNISEESSFWDVNFSGLPSDSESDTNEDDDSLFCFYF